MIKMYIIFINIYLNEYIDFFYFHDSESIWIAHLRNLIKYLFIY